MLLMSGLDAYFLSELSRFHFGISKNGVFFIRFRPFLSSFFDEKRQKYVVVENISR